LPAGHLRALGRVAATYGEEASRRAARRALDYRRFNAEAVRRSLERAHPVPEPPPVTPMSPAARTLALLSEVDPASLDSFAHLDTATPAEATPNDSVPETEPGSSEPAAEPERHHRDAND